MTNVDSTPLTIEQIAQQLADMKDDVQYLMDRRIIQQDIVSGVIKEKHMVTDTVIAPGDMFYGDGNNNILRVAANTVGNMIIGPTNQVVTSSTLVDVTGVTSTVTVRPNVTSNYLLLASQQAYLGGQAAGDFSGTGITAIMVDGVEQGRITMAGRVIAAAGEYENADLNTRSTFAFVSLTAGSHTIALQASVTQGAVGNAKLVLNKIRLGIIRLGL